MGSDGRQREHLSKGWIQLLLKHRTGFGLSIKMYLTIYKAIKNNVPTELFFPVWVRGSLTTVLLLLKVSLPIEETNYGSFIGKASLYFCQFS